jgi:hypothetical protein
LIRCGVHGLAPSGRNRYESCGFHRLQ